MKKRVILAPPIRRRPTSTALLLPAPQSRSGDQGKGDPPNPFRGLGSPSVSPGSQVPDLLQKANKLTEAERKELAEALLLGLHLDSKRNGPARDVEMWSSAVHAALQKAIGGSGGDLLGPAVLRKQLAVVSAWQPVEDFMKHSRLVELTVTERQACYNLLATMIVGHARIVARKSGAPLCGKLVSKCTPNLSGVFENAFPGYLEAGLAKVVARQSMQ